MSTTAIKPATWNIVLYQGDHFPFRFDVILGGNPVDFTVAGNSVRAQIRKNAADDFVLAEFDVVSAGADGSVHLELSPAETATLTPGVAEWDCEITVDGRVRTIFKGTATVNAEVTR